MEFNIKFDTVKSGWTIQYIEMSQVIISKKYCISFSEDWFRLRKHWRTWWNSTLCCISSGSSLFVNVPFLGVSDIQMVEVVSLYLFCIKLKGVKNRLRQKQKNSPCSNPLLKPLGRHPRQVLEISTWWPWSQRRWDFMIVLVYKGLPAIF